MDYASDDTRRVGEALIQKELNHIPKEAVRKVTAEHLNAIANGQRDFRF